MVKEFNTISMIGLGYIGLPTAAMFASRKIKVIGVDVNQSTVNTINRGQIHIIEPELDMIVGVAVSQGFLRATTKPESADAFLIAVPTPFKGDHEPDLTYVEAAAKSIALVIKKGDLVILESTSPVGTTEQMADWLASARPDLSFPQQAGEKADVNIAYCPERVLPGRVVQELVNNDRIIGGMTPKCSLRAISLYKTFVEGQCIETNARTAEMCKLAENSYRDVNIAFANELSIVCEKLDVNVWDLVKLANHHPRVQILDPGPGVGGHCLAIDPWFIVSRAPEEARLIRTARTVNDAKSDFVVNQIRKITSGLNNPKIAFFGLAYKPNIDDIRESPAIKIVKSLLNDSFDAIFVVEPHLKSLPLDLGVSKVKLVKSELAIEQADIFVLLVNHLDFMQHIHALRLKEFVCDVSGLLNIKVSHN